jgi:biofilm PGA synthesis lipoprotein PgaB
MLKIVKPAALIISLLLVLVVIPPAQAQALPHLKAIQVLVLPDTTPEGIRSFIRPFKKAGFDTVILRAFQLPGDRHHGTRNSVNSDDGRDSLTGVYFPTTRAPIIKDLITPFVQACRMEGVRPFAWMVTRDAKFGNSSLPPEIIFHPDTGTLSPTPRLDIFDPAVRNYLKALFQDLARTGVEGILLQDDLSSRMVEGFSETGMGNYRTASRDVVPPFLYLEQVTTDDGRKYLKTKPGFDRWIAWKTEGLVSLASELQASVAAITPDASLVMNQMYETITDPDNGRLWLSQDLLRSLDDGPPYAAVMLYHRQMQKELDLGSREIATLIRTSLLSLGKENRERSRIMLKFQTRDWKTGNLVDPGELLGFIDTAVKGGWSLALVPEPSEEQMRVLSPVLQGR